MRGAPKLNMVAMAQRNLRGTAVPEIASAIPVGDIYF